ncbi:hypothetical protein Ahy_B02g057621 [Arachis hypogaea]|uniref:Serine-threonine/tyrosine-protein kinase catalytic domain-containing protein n=1 Tax=Arachis hypogaea TaxID=3818 RepID=A0A445ACP6_ARAHY|nr:hypothetical protein Ahy_B02g057621 [Arachis hypogaea]
MTNSFHEKLGEGRYGIVYKVNLADGQQVAVKILKELKETVEEFVDELEDWNTYIENAIQEFYILTLNLKIFFWINNFVQNYDILILEIIGGRQNYKNGASDNSENYFPIGSMKILNKEIFLQGVCSTKKKKMILS